VRVSILFFSAACLIANIASAAAPIGAAPKDAAGTFMQLADRYDDASIAPLLLFKASSLYLYRLNDEDSARMAFNKLLDRYPANELASKKTVLYRRLAAKKAGPFDIGYRIEKLMASEGFLKGAGEAQKIFTSHKEPSAQLPGQAAYKVPGAFGPVAEGYSASHESRRGFRRMNLLELINNDQVRAHALFTRRLPFNVKNVRFGSDGSSVICDGWQGTARSEFIGIRKMSIRQRGANKVELNGIISTGGVDFDARIVGRRKAQGGGYIIEECRLGQFNIPPELANEVLSRTLGR